MAWEPSPCTFLVVFTIMNFLNYVDRGVLSGAEQQFEFFVSQTLQVELKDQATYIGFLNSVYIGCYAVASITAGYLVNKYRPLSIVALGLLLWAIAVVMSGTAKWCNNFYLLAFGRGLSGCGEASFQCIVPTFIDNLAPVKSKSAWFGFFYTAIPVGTAVGYGYGSLMAGPGGMGWGWAYVLEGIVIIPFILFCVVVRFPREKETIANSISITQSLTEATRANEHTAVQSTTLCQGIWFCFTSPIFMTVTLGYAAFTATLMGLSTFGPVFLMGLGMFDTQSEASIMFGVVLAVSGLIGTPLGGLFADCGLKGYLHVADKKRAVMGYIFALASVGLGFMIAAALANQRVWLLTLLGCSLVLLFASNPLITMMIMWSVPKHMRALAMAMEVLLMHAVGDVPSPIVLGAIKGWLAPLCGPVITDDTVALNPECYKDRAGLRNTLVIGVLWMGWTVLLWLIGWVIAGSQARKKRANSAENSLFVSVLADVEDAEDEDLYN